MRGIDLEGVALALVLLAGCRGAPEHAMELHAVGGRRNRGPRVVDESALLPEQSCRTFVPVDPAWIKELSYLIPGRDSYRVIAPEDRDPQHKGYHRQLRFFRRPSDTRFCKILRYHPSGYPTAEIDSLDDHTFSRTFYADGSVRSYHHQKGGKLVAGYTVSPDGEAVHHLEDGTGHLVYHGRKRGRETYDWFCQGFNFLRKRYVEGVLSEVRLNRVGAYLIMTRERERLTLSEDCEAWTKERDKDPGVQIMDTAIGTDGSLIKVDVPEKKDIRPMNRWGHESQEIRREWAEAYPKRRRAFLDLVGEMIRRAGCTWEGLGIEALRKPNGWPEGEDAQLPTSRAEAGSQVQAPD